MQVSLVIALALALCCGTFAPSNASSHSGRPSHSGRCLIRPISYGNCKSLGYGWVYERNIRDCVYTDFQCRPAPSVFKNKQECRNTCKGLSGK
ncbi:uncharacterized protein LOC143031994 isoform X3 [Oratosquilla oratoria]|uniref:uncharacterized protein LOC143031994 isoform X3 n=1 Tax=Oratosquilla oratoria TaxID=337810 RepID=UPI003F763D8A